MKTGKSKDKDSKSKKSKDSKLKKDDQNKSDKSGASKSKSKGKEKSVSKGKDKEGSKTPTKKDTKSKKPVDGQSEISSISQTPVAPADCIHHKSPFINFCQTCEELVCSQCTVFGPHNNHLHRILKMTDAYRLRKFYLVEAIRSNLVDKRDKIIAQLHRLEYRVEQIKFVRNIIERDIRSQYAGILQRLRNYEGSKMAVLTHEVSLVQRELDTINDLGNRFFELTSMECEKIEQERRANRFLLQSKEMYESIEYITSRPEREVPPELGLSEIPREVQANRDLVKKALAARQINNFKNEILWKLVTDLKAQENAIKREVEERASSAIRELSEDVQALSEKLKQHKLICFFCGVKMGPECVNNLCEQNRVHNKPERRFQTEKYPSEKQTGNQRHFFTKLLPA